MNRQSSRAFVLALVLTSLLGCASAAKTVAGYQNGYDYRLARYTEACVVPAPPAECTPTVAELHAAEKHLHEAAAALKWGGQMPLQLGALKADAAKLTQRKVAQ